MSRRFHPGMSGRLNLGTTSRCSCSRESAMYTGLTKCVPRASGSPTSAGAWRIVIASTTLWPTVSRYPASVLPAPHRSPRGGMKHERICYFLFSSCFFSSRIHRLVVRFRLASSRRMCHGIKNDVPVVATSIRGPTIGDTCNLAILEPEISRGGGSRGISDRGYSCDHSIRVTPMRLDVLPPARRAEVCLSPRLFTHGCSSTSGT